jgi:hypothetical protein
VSRIDRGIGYMLNTADVSQASLFLASQNTWQCLIQPLYCMHAQLRLGDV